MQGSVVVFLGKSEVGIIKPLCIGCKANDVAIVDLVGKVVIYIISWDIIACAEVDIVFDELHACLFIDVAVELTVAVRVCGHVIDGLVGRDASKLACDVCDDSFVLVVKDPV